MSSRSPLFRKEAQEARHVPSIGAIVLARPLSFSIATIIALCLACGVILLFALGSYTRRTTVDGLVMPDTGLVKIYTPRPGVIVKRHVREEERVVQGQTLFTVSSELQSAGAGPTQSALIAQARQRKLSLQQQMEKTRTLQQNERDALKARIANLREALASIDTQLAAQSNRASLAADAAARYERLFAQHFISKDQAQQRQADLLDQQANVHRLRRDRAGIQQTLKEAESEFAGLAFKQQNQLSPLTRGMIEIEEAVIENEARREFVVTAPEPGVIAAVIAEPGQMADGTHPIAGIVPEGAHWQAHLFVPSAAIGFVKIGDAVLIRYQAYPYQRFGQYPAKVVSVARTALSAAELATTVGSSATSGTFYRITVALQKQHVNAYGVLQKLQAGMTLQADILQERRRLYEWILDPLYSLTGKL